MCEIVVASMYILAALVDIKSLSYLRAYGQQIHKQKWTQYGSLRNTSGGAESSGLKATWTTWEWLQRKDLSHFKVCWSGRCLIERGGLYDLQCQRLSWALKTQSQQHHPSPGMISFFYEKTASSKGKRWIESLCSAKISLLSFILLVRYF